MVFFGTRSPFSYITGENEETILYSLSAKTYLRIINDYPDAKAYYREIAIKKQIFLKRVRMKVREAIFTGLA